MLQSASVLVDILRAFLLADQSMRRIFARYREGVLTFDEVQRLVGDDERSVLFRLKERSHALFRGGDHAPGIATQREALFDLAVGSLFHEAMKFRENLYQRTVYGPKVRALRSQSGPDAAGIFDSRHDAVPRVIAFSHDVDQFSLHPIRRQNTVLDERCLRNYTEQAAWLDHFARLRPGREPPVP